MNFYWLPTISYHKSTDKELFQNLENLKLGVSEHKILKINNKKGDFRNGLDQYWIFMIWLECTRPEQNVLKKKRKCYVLQSWFDIHDIPNCTLVILLITSQTKQLIVQIHNIHMHM